jgi:hypothetical protein
VRWRPDKDPLECRMADLSSPEPLDIREVLAAQG